MTRRRYSGGRLAKGETQTAHKRARSPNLPVGRWIVPARRLAIYLRDEFRCLLCGRDLSSASPREISLDHWRPRAKGGSNASTNLFTACHTCNSRRGCEPLSFECRQAVKTTTRRSTREQYKLALRLTTTGSWPQAVYYAQLPFRKERAA